MEENSIKELSQNLGHAAPDEIKAVPAEREGVAPEEDLNAETLTIATTSIGC